MAEVRAFSGVRYRLDRPDEAAAVIAPPYDVVSPADAAALRERNPHNVIRLELPEAAETDTAAENRYTRAATLFQEWLKSGVFTRDEQPCLYVYGQRYTVDGRTQERLGLMGALKVEPYEAGVVLPHEQTFPKHKEDRYRLLTTAKAQFSPIFGLYSAPGQGVRAELDRWTSGEPAAVAVDREGVEHRLWAVSDPGFARWIGELFQGRQVFIADGHHRYETALRYRNERREADPEAAPAPYDYVMTFLVEMDDPGLVLLPTHRLVRGLDQAPDPAQFEEHFSVEPVNLAEVDQLRHHQIGLVVADGEAYRFTLRDRNALDRLDTEHSAAWRDLDVALLHRLVFGEILPLGESAEIVYTRDPAEARSRVLSGEFQASFLLPHPRVEELKLVAGAGDKMPEKSTYFWPKAVTGLVIYSQ